MKRIIIIISVFLVMVAGIVVLKNSDGAATLIYNLSGGGFMAPALGFLLVPA